MCIPLLSHTRTYVGTYIPVRLAGTLTSVIGQVPIHSRNCGDGQTLFALEMACILEENNHLCSDPHFPTAVPYPTRRILF